MTEEVKSDEATPRLPRDEAKAIAVLTGLYLHEDETQLHSILAIRKMVVAEVVDVYTRVDRTLDAIITQHFLGFDEEPDEVPGEKLLNQCGEKRTQFRQLILDEMFLLKKKKVVQGISTIPEKIGKIIYRINDVRNDLTHRASPWDMPKNQKFTSTSSFNFGGKSITTGSIFIRKLE